MARGSYTGGSTLVYTGNHGGIAAPSVERDRTPGVALPRQGGSRIDLSQQRAAVKSLYRAKRSKATEAARSRRLGVTKTEIAVADDLLARWTTRLEPPEAPEDAARKHIETQVRIRTKKLAKLRKSYAEQCSTAAGAYGEDWLLQRGHPLPGNATAED